LIHEHITIVFFYRSNNISQRSVLDANTDLLRCRGTCRQRHSHDHQRKEEASDVSFMMFTVHK
ncbi:hypothetical protein, partial [uncultured Duncaniella sp.]|uniref:hypothetical protein n=1 Tax=uncultured Duncaniella sp. TaxID=2768039 RepID=UPI002608B24F